MTALVALLLAQAPIPSGGYGVADLCKILTKSTGKVHRVVQPLTDWGVYVRLKSPTLDKVKANVATALRAEWKDEGGEFVLRQLKTFDPHSEPAFTAGWLKATEKEPALAGIPTKTLYRMRVGDQLVFSSAGEPDTIKIPPGPDKQPRQFLLRRLVGNMFEWGQMAQTMAVLDLQQDLKPLGEGINKALTIPKDLMPSARMGGSTIAVPDAQQPDAFVNLRRMTKLLDAIATTADIDVVAAVPDGMWAIGFEFDRPHTVRTCLEGLAGYVDWTVSNGTLLGSINAADFGAVTQCDRAKFNKVLQSPPPVFDTPALALLDREQPSLANISSNTIVQLMLANMTVEGTPHFPFDVRLYGAMSDRDWQVVRMPGATLADLSTPAVDQIRTLAAKSRVALEGKMAEVRSLPHAQIPVSLKESESDAVFFRYGGRSPELMDTLNLAAHRAWKQFDEQQAGYMVVSERLLKLTIGQADIDFTKVEIPAGAKYIRFLDLPKDIREAIEKVEQSIRSQDGGG